MACHFRVQREKRLHERRPKRQRQRLIGQDYVGGSGPSVTITVEVDLGNNGGVDQTFPVSLPGGQCRDVWVTGDGDLVRVTETVPSGYTASYVRSVNVGGTITTDPSASGNSASGLVSGNAGALVIFTNTPVTPPAGNEGCTPGYWKQPHHFDSWPAAYTPGMQFSAVFDNAFPGKTLVQVLSNGGGGLDALGRHIVAALLNAGSSGVGFGMTTTQVINAFNGVFPGGDYEALKNQFARLNERRCPLN